MQAIATLKSKNDAEREFASNEAPAEIQGVKVEEGRNLQFLKNKYFSLEVTKEGRFSTFHALTLNIT